MYYYLCLKVSLFIILNIMFVLQYSAGAHLSDLILCLFRCLDGYIVKEIIINVEVTDSLVI